MSSRQCDCLHQFKPKIRELIRNEPLQVRSIRVFRGTCVYSSGERDASLYCVDSGQIKLILYTPEGRECVLAIRSTGDIFGELCLSGQLIRVETAVAMQESRLSAIPYINLLRLMRAANLLEDLVQYLGDCIARQQEFIASMLTVNSEHRLALVLLRLGSANGTDESRIITIRPRILYEDLAAMVGTTRSRVGVFLKRFQENGLIEMNADHSLTIETEKLRQFAAGSALTEDTEADPCRIRLRLTSPSPELETSRK